jgi:hypothetical protein
MASLDPDLKSVIVGLVNDMVAGRYAEIAADGRIGRVLTPETLEEAIHRYPISLLPLPDQAWDLTYVHTIKGNPKTLVVEVPMFTKEEGRSDLTLTLSANREDHQWKISIDDLHVL